MKKHHRLLRRQVKKANFTEMEEQKLLPFLETIDVAYKDFENDVTHIETILEKSSKELYEANQNLKNNVKDISNQLTKVAGNIKEVIFEVDLDGNWSYLNPAWEELMGYAVKETLKQPYYKYIKDITGNPFKELSKLGLPNFDANRINVEVLTGTNENKWLDITVKSVKSNLGEIEGYIGTIVDITDVKKTEMELISAKEKATLANNAKDDFLSTMSHEIRTPLNAVIGVSHLLLLEDPKKEQMENLDALKYSSEHLLDLVNDILDFNKIASGSLELEDTDFNLDRILNGLQFIFLNKAKEKGIRFTIKKDNALPNMLMGDSTRITQILTNLINNAIKFTEAGKVTLDMELENETPEHCFIRFEVRDTGIGISEDKREKIFDSFSQANSDTTRKYGGTGLGLAICKKLIEFMGGELTVDSILGKGSTFSFGINLKKSEVEEKDDIVFSSKDVFDIEDVKSLKGIKILVAEDNTLNVLVIRKFLMKWDVLFEIAENGKVAVEMAEANCYDLILMDLQMPVMNGFDAARAIRDSENSLNKDIPIYALSASAGVDIKQKIIKHGLNGLICKPFNPVELYVTLSKIVHQPQRSLAI